MGLCWKLASALLLFHFVLPSESTDLDDFDTDALTTAIDRLQSVLRQRLARSEGVAAQRMSTRRLAKRLGDSGLNLNDCFFSPLQCDMQDSRRKRSPTLSALLRR